MAKATGLGLVTSTKDKVLRLLHALGPVARRIYLICVLFHLSFFKFVLSGLFDYVGPVLDSLTPPASIPGRYSSTFADFN